MQCRILLNIASILSEQTGNLKNDDGYFPLNNCGSAHSYEKTTDHLYYELAYEEGVKV